MTKGRQMPMNSKVRRRLVFDDESEPGESETELKGVDYLSDARSEFAARDLENEMILKGMKWNFDFEKEIAYDGPLQWFRKGSDGKWEEMEAIERFVNTRKRKHEAGNSAQVTCKSNGKVSKLSDEKVEDEIGNCNAEEIYLSEAERTYKSDSDVQIDKLNELGAQMEVTPKVASKGSKGSNPPGMRAKAVKTQALSARARRRICFE